MGRTIEPCAINAVRVHCYCQIIFGVLRMLAARDDPRSSMKHVKQAKQSTVQKNSNNEKKMRTKRIPGRNENIYVRHYVV
jgi:hypothetical protein